MTHSSSDRPADTLLPSPFRARQTGASRSTDRPARACEQPFAHRASLAVPDRLIAKDAPRQVARPAAPRILAVPRVLAAMLAVAIGAALPMPARAQDAKSPPELAVAKPEQDLGIVGLGTNPTVDFAIRNAGAQPLTIQVGPMPKGLRLAQADATIAPGSSGVVRLQLDTFTVAETPEWRVVLTTNDPLHKSQELVIRAEVRAFLSLTPPSARFTFVQFGKEGGTSHVLAADDGAPMEVLGVDSPFDFITATARELTGAERNADLPGRQWRIDLTIAGSAPVGPISGYVIARTTHARQPRAFLPVSGFVRPLFAVTPAAVNLHDVRSSATGDGPIETLHVKNFGAEPIALTGASSDIAGLTAKIVEVETGHVWRVELRMSARAGAPGPFTGTLRLATSSRHRPEVTVPIQGTRLHDAQP